MWLINGMWLWMGSATPLMKRVESSNWCYKASSHKSVTTNILKELCINEVIGKNMLLTHPCDLPLLFIIPTALSVVYHTHLEQCHRWSAHHYFCIDIALRSCRRLHIFEALVTCSGMIFHQQMGPLPVSDDIPPLRFCLCWWHFLPMVFEHICPIAIVFAVV